MTIISSSAGRFNVGPEWVDDGDFPPSMNRHPLVLECVGCFVVGSWLVAKSMF